MYPSYDQLESTLARVGAAISVAESHGILCGLYTMAGFIDQSLWLAHVLDEELDNVGNDADFGRLIKQLVEETQRQIDDESFVFQPLLPEDFTSLEVRTESLGLWCQGALFGLGLGGLQDRQEMPDNCQEFINDLARIARTDIEVDSESEANESALNELFEYLRIGLLLLRDELAPAASSNQSSQERLH